MGLSFILHLQLDQEFHVSNSWEVYLSSSWLYFSTFSSFSLFYSLLVSSAGNLLLHSWFTVFDSLAIVRVFYQKYKHQRFNLLLCCITFLRLYSCFVTKNSFSGHNGNEYEYLRHSTWYCGFVRVLYVTWPGYYNSLECNKHPVEKLI